MAAQVRETTRRRSCRTALHKARPPSCTRASRRDAAPPQPLRRSSIRPVSPSAASRVTCTTTGDVSIRRLRMSADAGYRRRRPCRSREGTNLHSEARRHPRAVLLAARRGLIARQAPAVAPGASAPFSSPAVSRAERQLSGRFQGPSSIPCGEPARTYFRGTILSGAAGVALPKCDTWWNIHAATLSSHARVVRCGAGIP